MFAVCYRVKVKGTTDAKIVRSEFFALLTNSSHVPSLDDAMTLGLSAPRWFTKEDSGTNRYLPVWKVGKEANITAEDTAGIKGGTKFLHFWGFVEYEDIFGRPHMSKFRWIWKLREYAFGDQPSGYWGKYGPDEDNSDC